MSTETPVPTPAPETPPPAAAPPPPAVSAKEIEEGKVFAILSYVIPLFFLVPLIQRNNDFSLYHAKQVLLLAICAIVLHAVLAASCFLVFLTPIASLAVLVFVVLGLINAVKGEIKPIPLIGSFAEKWFAGLKKA